MIDWLATRNGRLVAFFLLYATEGLPLGFTATFVATLMRREGVSPAAIGTFVATLYLPWSFKFFAGPFVDLFRSRRLGPRRAWIVSTQLAMTLSLMTLAWFNAVRGIDVTHVALFTTVVVISNVFGAIQDVAIDALAVDTLHESERGLANGLMFAGAAIGQALGGSGALFLYDAVGFVGATLSVGGWLLGVTLFVSLWLKERPVERTASTLVELAANDDRSPFAALLQRALSQVLDYAVTAARAFFGSARGLLGLVLALLPAGGMALGLTLQTNLAVELGLSDNAIATLNIASTVAFALFCAAGGLISDHFGRVRSLAIFIALTALPTLAFAGLMWKADWIMPVDPTLPNRPSPPDWLVQAFWAATIVFNMANGLMYGTRSAFFMDFCEPRAAATQFTAYMAAMNLVIAYSAFWQGRAIEAFGYPATLTIDAGFGLACLAVLALVPLTRNPQERRPQTPDEITCPACGTAAPADATACPMCGEPLSTAR
ncbi:MAG: MFS transporter [Planctomycetaceae bacterium]